MRTLLLLLAGVACAAGARDVPPDPSADPAAGLARELAGLVPGRPQQCLPTLTSSRASTRAYGDTLVYQVSRSLKYRTETNGGCGAVGRRDAFLVTRSPSGRTCSGDIATALDRGSRFVVGSCSLGEFVPYRRP